MSQRTEEQCESIEAFLQDLLFLVKKKEQRDLLVELLLTMQGPPGVRVPIADLRTVRETHFETFKRRAATGDSKSYLN